MKQSDIEYYNDGLFIRFMPNTQDGVSVWNTIAADNDGVAAVLAIHGEAVIRQIKAAGYSVSKARKVSMADINMDDELLAELEA